MHRSRGNGTRYQEMDLRTVISILYCIFKQIFKRIHFQKFSAKIDQKWWFLKAIAFAFFQKTAVFRRKMNSAAKITRNATRHADSNAQTGFWIARLETEKLLKNRINFLIFFWFSLSQKCIDLSETDRGIKKWTCGH